MSGNRESNRIDISLASLWGFTLLQLSVKHTPTKCSTLLKRVLVRGVTNLLSPGNLGLGSFLDKFRMFLFLVLLCHVHDMFLSRGDYVQLMVSIDQYGSSTNALVFGLSKDRVLSLNFNCKPG